MIDVKVTVTKVYESRIDRAEAVDILLDYGHADARELAAMDDEEFAEEFQSQADTSSSIADAMQEYFDGQDADETDVDVDISN